MRRTLILRRRRESSTDKTHEEPSLLVLSGVTLEAYLALSPFGCVRPSQSHESHIAIATAM